MLRPPVTFLQGILSGQDNLWEHCCRDISGGTQWSWRSCDSVILFPAAQEPQLQCCPKERSNFLYIIKLSHFDFFVFRCLQLFTLKSCPKEPWVRGKGENVGGAGKNSIIILEVYLINKIENLTNITCLLNCTVNIPKISFVLELLYVVNMKTRPSYPVSRKLSCLHWSNLKAFQNHLIKYVAFQDLLCIFSLLYCSFSVLRPSCHFLIQLHRRMPRGIRRMTSPSPCSPILSIQVISCILQAGYRAKLFHLGLVDHKPLQPGLWERNEAFPHWQRVTSFGPCGSQGESGQDYPVAQSKIGVSLALGKKRIEKVYQRELHLYAMTTMSWHLWFLP